MLRGDHDPDRETSLLARTRRRKGESSAILVVDNTATATDMANSLTEIAEQLEEGQGALDELGEAGGDYRLFDRQGLPIDLTDLAARLRTIAHAAKG